MVYYNFMFKKFLIGIICVCFPIQAYGQICSISEYPYGFMSSDRPKMHGNTFKDISGDVPFTQNKGAGSRYSEFWINANVLNVRSGPGLGHDIITQTYFGNLVFAYAKRGDWVSIRPRGSFQKIEAPSEWVHVNYLSATRISNQVDTDILKSKCSFERYANSGPEGTNASQDKSMGCKSVLNYLSKQRWLSRKHTYWQEYEAWRSRQENPETYRPVPCSRAKRLKG